MEQATEQQNTGEQVQPREVELLKQQEESGPKMATQEATVTEEEKDAQREQGKWQNYVPPEAKRPIDEFFDLKSINPIRVEEVTPDGGIVKYVLEEGKGSYIGNTDEVFYKHETRFDTGQLVDFNEKRKASEKFEMKDIRFHDYYKIVMRTMRKGDTVWVKFSKEYHRSIYHQSSFFQSKTEEEKKLIGDDIYIRL